VDLRRSLPVAGLAALAITGTALVRPAVAAPAAPAGASVAEVATAPAAAQAASLPAGAHLAATHPTRYASSVVRAMQSVLGVTADGIWGPITDRAAWKFESQVYMQWPNQASKVAAMQRAFNLDTYSPDIKVDGAWGAETEYKFRGLRTRLYTG
jgi:pyruvate/2-oxoglutarate dehydrogenase complex dihydrolipoamide acyltransferase (E2) component